MPPITDAPTLGDGLKTARKAAGLSLEDLSAVTRVHIRYLRALEQNDSAILPSRVFAIGYVRAYASALGLDEQLAVERFKRDVPDPSVPLQPPTGLAFQEVKRQSPRIIAAVILVSLGIVGWNLFQRFNLFSPPAASELETVPENWSLGKVPGQDGVVRLSVPRTAPPDQTVPQFYVTRGLESQLDGQDPNTAAGPAATAPVQKAFNPRGAVYGSPATASQVVLQARKASSLVVRTGDGRVIFARQLAVGEAWRAPLGVAATIDASDPTAFDLYLNGEHAGTLEAGLTPLAGLNRRAEALARQAAEDTARRTEAAVRSAQAMSGTIRTP